MSDITKIAQEVAQFTAKSLKLGKIDQAVLQADIKSACKKAVESHRKIGSALDLLCEVEDCTELAEHRCKKHSQLDDTAAASPATESESKIYPTQFGGDWMKGLKPDFASTSGGQDKWREYGMNEGIIFGDDPNATVLLNFKDIAAAHNAATKNRERKP